jgi:hypothetical protein
MLPCGETCCAACEQTAYGTTNKPTYKCLICDIKHEKLNGCLPVNLYVQRLLKNFRPSAEAQKNGQDTLEAFKNSIDSFAHKYTNSASHIKKHFTAVKADVDNQAWRIICLINKYRDEMLVELNKNEEKCLTNDKKTNKNSNNKFQQLIDESEQMFQKWSSTICLNNGEIDKLIQEVKHLGDKLKQNDEALEKFIYSQGKIQFDLVENDGIHKTHIGKLTACPGNFYFDKIIDIVPSVMSIDKHDYSNHDNHISWLHHSNGDILLGHTSDTKLTAIKKFNSKGIKLKTILLNDSVGAPVVDRINSYVRGLV